MKFRNARTHRQKNRTNHFEREGCVVISFRVILETVLSYLVRIEEEIRRIRLREFACPLDTNRIVKIIDKSEEIDSFPRFEVWQECLNGRKINIFSEIFKNIVKDKLTR